MDTRKAKILGSESYDSNLKLRYGAEETLSEYPNKITIKNGWFTTSPYENPNYKINTRESADLSKQKKWLLKISA